MKESTQFWNCPENRKWPRKIRMVLKLCGKWEVIRKNPDSFDTIRKIGNDPEKSGQLWNCPENGKWSGKIQTVFTPTEKWEMIWKYMDNYDTVWKMGNDLEKSGQLIRFFLLCAQKFLDETKKFRVAMLPCYPGFCTSGIRQHYRLNITTNIETAVLSMRY